MANERDCNIIVSEFELHLWYNVLFPTITFGKGMHSFTPKLSVKSYHCWFSTMISLPLATKVDMPLTIIMSCHRHRYPWSSLATSPYRSSPLAGLQGYIPYPHIAAVCMFELVVLLLPGHMWGPLEYITYELVPASPAVSCMSGSSDLDSFVMGGRLVSM